MNFKGDSEMKCFVKIMPREVILDTQGRVLQNHLKDQGFQTQNIRVGKMIEMTLTAESQQSAEIEIQKMLKYGLYNPLIETYEIQYDK